MATDVRVTLPIGEATFPRATASVFEKDVLTISSVDTDYILEEYGPDRWLSCSVYDAGGWPVFWFVNSQQEERIKAVADSLTPSMERAS